MRAQTSQKTFTKFRAELESEPFSTNERQRPSQAQESHRQKSAKSNISDDDDNAERRPGSIRSIRIELAAMYLMLDRKLVALEASGDYDDAPAHGSDVHESLQTHALTGAPEGALVEGDQLLSQTKSNVLRIVQHVQGLNREIFRDSISNRVNKNSSAQATCLASLIAILIGIVVREPSIVERANTFRV
jgi:hypothetical protein